MGIAKICKRGLFFFGRSTDHVLWQLPTVLCTHARCQMNGINEPAFPTPMKHKNEEKIYAMKETASPKIGWCNSITCILVVLEKDADGFAVVYPSDRLCENAANLQYFEFRAQALVLFLWDTVSDDDFVDGARVDASDGVAAENSVCEESVDVGSALSLYKLGGAGNGVGCISEIIDDNGDPASDISHKHHGGVLAVSDASRTTFLGFN